MPFWNIFSDMFILNWSQQHYKCYHMNETQDTKKQTPILSINNLIITIYPTVSCRSWRAVDYSQNNRVLVDRYVTPIYVDLGY